MENKEETIQLASPPLARELVIRFFMHDKVLRVVIMWSKDIRQP